MTFTTENAVPFALTAGRRALSEDVVGDAYGEPPLLGSAQSCDTSPRPRGLAASGVPSPVARS